MFQKEFMVWNVLARESINIIKYIQSEYSQIGSFNQRVLVCSCVSRKYKISYLLGEGAWLVSPYAFD